MRRWMMLIRRTAGVTIGLALLLCCAGSRFVEGLSAQSAGAVAGQQEPRPTSTPYKGDLSIFEYPDRDEKLHVDRVMDLLGIVPGKSVADVGAGSGWFTRLFELRRESALVVRSTPKTSIQRRSKLHHQAGGTREAGKCAADIGDRRRYETAG